MAAELFSVSFISRLSPANQSLKGYYRSKLFIAPYTTNTLVAAAGPLLSLLDRLCITPCLPSLTSVRDNIEHELQAFHSRLEGKTQTDQLSALAHYLLCATIDELLGKNYLRIYGEVAEFQAFTPSSFDDIEPQKRFFDIVNYIKDRPTQYLDLLELAYYCLIAGFEGEQHGRADGRQVLDNLLEELYQLIQQHRVNKPPRLFSSTKILDVSPKKTNKSLIILFFVTLGVLGTSYLTSHVLLEHKAKTLQFGHTLITKRDY